MVRTGTPHDTLAFDMLDLSVVDLSGSKETKNDTSLVFVLCEAKKYGQYKRYRLYSASERMNIFILVVKKVGISSPQQCPNRALSCTGSRGLNNSVQYFGSSSSQNYHLKCHQASGCKSPGMHTFDKRIIRT